MISAKFSVRKKVFKKIIGIFFFALFSLNVFSVSAYKIVPNPQTGVIGVVGTDTSTCLNIYYTDSQVKEITVFHTDNIARPCYTENEIKQFESDQNATAQQQITAAEAAVNKKYEAACGTKQGSAIGDIDIGWSLCTAGQDFLRAMQGFFGGILYLSSRTFDLLVGAVIINTAEILKNDPTGQNVFYQSWSIVRDLANILGFFAAIYAGVSRIFGTDKEEFKKIMIRVLLFALLTNFSYPITRSLIDFSNVLSLNIYGGIANYKKAETVFNNDAGVSSKLMSAFGLNDFLTVSTDVNGISKLENKSPLASVTSFTGTIILILFFLFLSFIMIKACIFVIARIATLIICVIMSPVMFIGGLHPLLSKIQEQWQKAYIDSLVVGPVLMISLWLGIQVMTGSKAALSIATQGSDFALLIQLVFAAVVFYICMKMAEKYSGQIGQFGANALGKVTTGIAGGAALGVGGFAFRNTAGRLGNFAANNSFVKGVDSNSGLFKRATAGLLKSGGAGLSNVNIGKGRNNSYTDVAQKKASNIGSGAAGDTINSNSTLRKEFVDAKKNNDIAGLRAVERKADLLRSESTQNEIKAGTLTEADVLATNNRNSILNLGGKNKTNDQLSSAVQTRAEEENALRDNIDKATKINSAYEAKGDHKKIDEVKEIRDERAKDLRNLRATKKKELSDALARETGVAAPHDPRTA